VKLTTLLIITATLHLSARSFAQKISLSERNAPLTRIFEKIRKQTGYDFLVTETMLKNAKLVSIETNEEEFLTVLDKVFENQNLSYAIKSNSIIVKEKQLSVRFRTSELMSVIDITGKIVDENGSIISGATIKVKGEEQVVLSDAEGKFALRGLKSNAILVISYVGFITQEIKAGSGTDIVIKLISNTSGLNEVVVVGYGTQKKVNLTGAVATIDAKRLESRPITNLGQGLQGMIPNLNISVGNGRPGTGASFNIRGTTSINGGSPLVLVDNVQMDPNQINPSDVESVTVLKDASSTSIYGVRAAFGVVLITTKKGKKNTAPQFDYSFDYTLTKATRLPRTMNSLDYIRSHQEANATGAATGGNTASEPFTDLDLQKAMDYVANPIPENAVYIRNPTDRTYRYVGNTDWVSALYHSTAPQMQHNMSLSGGSDKLTYRGSFGYFDQKGILKAANQDFKRYNLNIDLKSDLNSWLTVNGKIAYNRKSDNSPAGGDIGSFERLSGDLRPIMPIRHPDGNFSGQQSFTNNLALLQNNGRSFSYENDLWLTGAFEIRPVKNIKVFGDYTWNTYTYNNTSNTKRYLEYGANGILLGAYPWTATPRVSESNSNDVYSVLNVYSQYENTFAEKHYLKLMIGYNQELKQNKSFNASVRNLLNQDMPVLSLNNDPKPNVGAGIQEWAVTGTFGRLNYIFDEKYMLELNGRYDGTSRFGRGKRYTFQPTGSAGWRISNEEFFKPLKDAINELKFRVSYGTIGNQATTTNYPYIATMPYGIGSYVFGSEQQPQIGAPPLVSRDFTWEKVTTLNYGVDFAFLNNKLTGYFDLFRRETKGMLVAGFPAPAVLGVAVPTRNAADLKTKGFELSLTWADQIGNDFSYNVTAGLSDYTSKITKFDLNTIGDIGSSNYYVGKSIGEIWGYTTDGLFQSDTEAAAAKQSQIWGGQWLAGDVKYRDVNGDGKIDWGNNTLSNPGDLKIIGNSTPRYQYNLNAGFNYKSFDFNMFWQGTGKRDMMLGGNFFWGYLSEWNVPSEALVGNYWTPENTNAYFPRLRFGGGGNFQTQTRYLQSAAYIRLKQLTLGYTLPQSLLNKVKLRHLRVYVTGQNLLESTKLYKNFDPEEFDRNGDYPINRGFSAGVQVKF